MCQTWAFCWCLVVKVLSHSPRNPQQELMGHRCVLWLMYGLFPVAFPIAKILDLLLGHNHGMTFDRLGLKTLLMFHEGFHKSTREHLTADEVSILSSVLDFDGLPISSVMIPLARIFSLSSDTFLNDMTRYNILKSGYSCIPIHLHTQPNTFVGVLQVKSLVSTNLEEEVTIGQISLESMPAVYSTESCLEILNVFRERKTGVLLVVEQGTGLPLGITTARDILELLIGQE
jgi:metal transporter CNNM